MICGAAAPASAAVELASPAGKVSVENEKCAKNMLGRYQWETTTVGPLQTF